MDFLRQGAIMRADMNDPHFEAGIDQRVSDASIDLSMNRSQSGFGSSTTAPNPGHALGRLAGGWADPTGRLRLGPAQLRAEHLLHGSIVAFAAHPHLPRALALPSTR